MAERRTHRSVLLLLLAGVAGCGLVNGLGGPWPPGPGLTDGGVVVTDGGACPDGQHNGGNGVCVGTDDCSSGFLLEESGRCARWEVLTVGLSPARALVAAVPLTQGRWLAVGGRNGGSPVGDAWIYDPDDGWAQSNGSIKPRFGHVASSLAGNRVVVVGGVGNDDVFEPVAELYRADQDTWAEVGALQRPRIGHAALEVGSGRFWAIGGQTETGAVLGSVEELEAGEWRTLSGLALDTARSEFATAFVGGKVYVFGGINNAGTPLSSVEVLDPAAGDGTTVAAMSDGRSELTATLLADGRVLILGGKTEVAGQDAVLGTSELYDPATDSWTAGERMRVPRYGHTVVTLDTGLLMVVGGFNDADLAVPAVELYDPDTGVFTEAAAMSRGRGHAAVITLPGEGAMVINGSATADDSSPVVTVERYDHP